MAKQPKPITYGIDAAAIGVAKLASDRQYKAIDRLHISEGRAYAADGFVIASADLPGSDPSDLREDSAVSFLAADIAALPWEDCTQRAYSLVDVKDVRIGNVFRSGDTIRVAHDTPADPANPGPCNSAGMRAIAEAQGIADREPVTTVLSLEMLGKILDVLREISNGIDGGAYYGGGLVLRVYTDDPDAPPEQAPRAVEWVCALEDGRTVEGILMPMVLPKVRAIVPHWRLNGGDNG
jgi:hypothetical protein